MIIQRVFFTCILITLVCVGSSLAIEMTTNETVPESSMNEQTDLADIQDAVPSLQEQPNQLLTGPDAEQCRTRLVLLGTTGGVSWFPDTESASSSSALVVGDTIYLIDLGQGSTARLSEAFNTGTFVDTPTGKIEEGSSTFLENVKVLFFTHLHMDHTADYPDFLLIGPGAGLGTTLNPTTNKTTLDPVIVIGPPNRGQLDADKTNFTEKGGQIIYTDSADPEKITPTPGTRQMTELIWQGYAQTINDMTLDDGYPDYQSLVKVKEIGGTESGDIPMPISVPDPNNGTCPAMEPFEVYRDNQVRVTAILVDHHQVFPSFAYRFDTDDGSVVFSGDTGPNTNGNMEKLANGADILIHEVIDPVWIELKFAGVQPGSQLDALKKHMYASHTSIDDVGSIAENSSVNTLILNHIVPGNTPETHLLRAQQNFSGNLIIGKDLMQIGLGCNSDS